MRDKPFVIDILQDDARRDLPNHPRGGRRCRDCKKAVEPWAKGAADFKRWDSYIARDEVWVEAGMRKWSSGYLCTPCFTKRLGRKPVRGKDLLLWIHSATKKRLRMHATAEYAARITYGRGY